MGPDSNTYWLQLFCAHLSALLNGIYLVIMWEQQQLEGQGGAGSISQNYLNIS